MRYFTRFGNNILFSSFRSILLSWKDFSTIDPYFYAKLTISSISFSSSIVDVSTKCVQWNSTFTVIFRTSNICTAKTTRNHCFDSLCSSTHCALDCLFLCTTE
ncbi:folylpolyglutamate synthase [Bacillus stratosphericus LAMA 585]|nr:folylpolyglutamate synthase [Bacillus stratosphericus LAMA 585]